MAASLVAVSYLCWAWPPHGRWYDLGALEGEPNRPETWFEAWINKAALGTTDAVAFTLRNIIGVIPAAILLSPLFLLLPLFQTAAYGVGWQVDRVQAIRIAEYLTGAIWGVFIWALV